MLFSNSEALRRYEGGTLPTVADVTRDVFIDDWRLEHRRPDHYLKNRREIVLRTSEMPFGRENTLAEVILKVLDDLGDRYLEWSGSRLHVREDLFGGWQDLLPRISPLLILSRRIQRDHGPFPHRGTQSSTRDYVRRFLEPNFRNSALPYPSTPQVGSLIRIDGLIEMHCHLNGSTEGDIVSLNALAMPREFYGKLHAAWTGRGWRRDQMAEQYQQIEPGLSPGKIWKRLRSGRDLRRIMSTCVFEELVDCRRDRIIRTIVAPRSLWNTRKHPAAEYLWNGDTSDLVVEAAFLTAVLQALDAGEDDMLAHAFYFCELVRAQILRLTIQQVEQVGFDQFQKITVNEARWLSEQTFKRRFHQLDVTDFGDLEFLEGRFAPKTNAQEIRGLIRLIEKGFGEFKRAVPETNRMKLGLVCHFIKQPESAAPTGYRYAKLRRSLGRSGRAVVAAFDHTSPQPIKDRLVGIDAASNEAHTPPEVFAPLFRYLRRRGAENFTYHVGEDFVHLLSGMRAIFEAITFLQLRPGNRIGHGTAIGLHPDVWLSAVGDRIVMKQGDHLDDIVYAHHRLVEIGRHQAVVSRLEDTIDSLSFRIYGRRLSPALLHKAWALRWIDPALAFSPRRVAGILDDSDRHAAIDALRELNDDSAAKELYSYYHGQRDVPLQQVYRRWDRLVEVESAIVPSVALHDIQALELSQIIRRNIAIESLPTSNMRIGFYNRYSQHHLFHWLGLSTSSHPRPVICIGSDDPGIFGVSLRAEYCHIYRELTQTFDRSPTEASMILERLMHNGVTFRFTAEANIRLH